MATPIKVFGIPNCDSTKKAINWLKDHSLETTLHDYKIEGIDLNQLSRWCKKSNWENILNKKSTTWRSLTEVEKNNVTNEANAISTMLKYPHLIKRPIVELGEKLLIGFNKQQFEDVI
jgi:Spx/MgsR family transcriptional regulator